MVFLKLSQREGSVRLPGKKQLTPFAFLIKGLGRRHPSSLICACAVDSGANFMSHLWSAMTERAENSEALSLSLPQALVIRAISGCFIRRDKSIEGTLHS